MRQTLHPPALPRERVGVRVRPPRLARERARVRVWMAVVLALTVCLVPWTVHADELPPSAYVDGVVGHPQEHNLSCESRSATDLAAYWGVGFVEDEFFHRLPKSDNPQRGFLGDVDLPPGSMPPEGYGVYAGPIAATLRSFGLAARALLMKFRVSRQGWVCPPRSFFLRMSNRCLERILSY